MLKIGCHLSVSKGYLNMGKEALSIGADTFQFFTRNPRGGSSKAVSIEDVNSLLELMKNHNFAPLLAHAPYTLNPCSADEKVRDFAYLAMREDLEKMEMLQGNLYNFHPGSHVGQGVEEGISKIIELLNTVL
ncbi:MAG: TIM barrel protein, partial [Clostridiales bacterium]|nr:TIM barrel protein [Clostridiales bacterium]